MRTTIFGLLAVLVAGGAWADSTLLIGRTDGPGSETIIRAIRNVQRFADVDLDDPEGDQRLLGMRDVLAHDRALVASMGPTLTSFPPAVPLADLMDGKPGVLFTLTDAPAGGGDTEPVNCNNDPQAVRRWRQVCLLAGGAPKVLHLRQGTRKGTCRLGPQLRLWWIERCN